MTRMHRSVIRSWWLSWVVCCSILPQAFGLDPSKALTQYVHDQWGPERGFIGGEVNSIAQSGDGYLWIGTTRGLVRFDGTAFQLIQEPLPGLAPAGPVRGMVSDGEGDVWIRYDGVRLLRYGNGVFEDVLKRFNLVPQVVTAMSPDSRGGVLFSELGTDLYRVNKGQIQAVPAARDVPGTISSIAETRDGTIWIGTREDGLFYVRDGLLSLFSDNPAERNVNTLLPAPNGGIWIGTDLGLSVWDMKAISHDAYGASLEKVHILSLTKDSAGNAWVGTNRGLARISTSGQVAFYPAGAAGDQITTTIVDREGELWFGGPHGVERLRDGTFTAYTKTQGLLAEKNGPLWVDASGRTWTAPLTGGLYWFKGTTVEKVSLAGLDGDVVYSISGDGNEVWLGRQRGGLTVLVDDSGSFTARNFRQSNGLAQDSVFTVKVASDHSVWAGTVSGGISRLKDGKFTTYTTADGLSSNTIVSIAEDRSGTIWVATPNGLDAFQNGRWTARGVRDGLPSAGIKTIFEDSDGVLWIATAEGLAHLDRGSIHVPRHLPDSLREPIAGMAEDALGDIWFTTADHVIEVSRDKLLVDSLAEADVRIYGFDDGLPGVEGVTRDRSVVSDDLHRVWMSLDRGIAMTGARLTEENGAPAAVRIDSVHVDRSAVNPGDDLRIGPESRNITFEFGVNSLSNLNRVRFRYRLEGYDAGWNDVTSIRQVTYTNLPPRLYRFRVTASDGSGLWNGPVTTVAFTMEPAYWQTWWFRVLLVASVLLLLAAAYRLRTVQLVRAMNMRFEERIAERTRIARELHDTLLQGVLSASMQLDVAEDQLPDESPVKPRLRRVMDLMTRVAEEGRNALQGLRTSRDGELSLEEAFTRFTSELTPDAGAKCRVVSVGASRPVRALICDEVYRICREALTNAFRHAQAKAVEVEIDYSRSQLRVLVRDDGRGIDSNVLTTGRDGHFGLVGMRERAEKIGGRLRLRSRIDAGTEVELTVPGPLAFGGDSPPASGQRPRPRPRIPTV